MDFSGGFEEGEIEGLGFGIDESSNEETSEADSGEISMDASPEPEYLWNRNWNLLKRNPLWKCPRKQNWISAMNSPR